MDWALGVHGANAVIDPLPMLFGAHAVPKQQESWDRVSEYVEFPESLEFSERGVVGVAGARGSRSQELSECLEFPECLELPECLKLPECLELTEPLEFSESRVLGVSSSQNLEFSDPVELVLPH